MKPTTIHNAHDCRKAVAGRIVAAFLAAGWAAAAQADSLQDPIKARAMCEKGGRAGSPAALKSCCSGLLMGSSSAHQKKLEAQCASGAASSRPEAVEARRDRRGKVAGTDAES